MLKSENYVVFDINCDESVPTNSNCSPEWRFCNDYKFNRNEFKLDCTIIDHIKLECKNNSMDIKPIENNKEKCQELELSSNDGIAKTVPEIMGIYSLDSYSLVIDNHVYHDMVIYAHVLYT